MSRSSIYCKVDRMLIFFFLNSVLILDLFLKMLSLKSLKAISVQTEYVSVELINNQYLRVSGRNKLHKRKLE